MQAVGPTRGRLPSILLLALASLSCLGEGVALRPPPPEGGLVGAYRLERVDGRRLPEPLERANGENLTVNLGSIRLEAQPPSAVGLGNRADATFQLTVGPPDAPMAVTEASSGEWSIEEGVSLELVGSSCASVGSLVDAGVIVFEADCEFGVEWRFERV